MGDWGLGIGPNPQSPIPNPQSPIIKVTVFLNFIFIILYVRNIILINIGDWGLGIGDWGLGPIPNPQSPIPNPQ